MESFENVTDTIAHFDRFEGKECRVYTITGQSYIGTVHMHGTWMEVTNTEQKVSAELNLNHVIAVCARC